MNSIGKGCKYPNIAEWMRREKKGYSTIADEIGSSTVTVHRALSCPHTSNITKYVIDGLLRVTGLTYEEAFYLPEGEKC